MPLQGQPTTEERLQHEITDLDARTRELLSAYQVSTSERPEFIATFEEKVREVITPAIRSFCARFPEQKSWFLFHQSISERGGTVIYDRSHVPVQFVISPPKNPHRYLPDARPHRFVDKLEYTVDFDANIVAVIQKSWRSDDREHHSETVRHLQLHEITPLQVEHDCSELFHTLMTALRDVAHLA